MPEVLLRAVRGEIKPTEDKNGLYLQIVIAIKKHRLPIAIIGMADSLPPAAIFVSSSCVTGQSNTNF